MKAPQVHPGRLYDVRVRGEVVTVRIEREVPGAGWEATNTTTNRTLHIRSARRLLNEVEPPPSEHGRRDAMGSWAGLQVTVRGPRPTEMPPGPFTVIGRKPVVKFNSAGEKVSRTWFLDIRSKDNRVWIVREELVDVVDGIRPSRDKEDGMATATKAPAKSAAKKPAAKKPAAKKPVTKKATAKTPSKAQSNGKGVGHGALSAEDRAARDATIVKMVADGANNGAISKATGMSMTGVRNAVIRLSK